MTNIVHYANALRLSKILKVYEFYREEYKDYKGHFKWCSDNKFYKCDICNNYDICKCCYNQCKHKCTSKKILICDICRKDKKCSECHEELHCGNICAFATETIIPPIKSKPITISHFENNVFENTIWKTINLHFTNSLIEKINDYKQEIYRYSMHMTILHESICDLCGQNDSCRDCRYMYCDSCDSWDIDKNVCMGCFCPHCCNCYDCCKCETSTKCDCDKSNYVKHFILK